MTRWYYNDQGVAAGPLDDQGLRLLLSECRITAATLIWNPEQDDWRSLAAARPLWFVELEKEKAALQEAPSKAPEAAIKKMGHTHQGGFLSRWFSRRP